MIARCESYRVRRLPSFPFLNSLCLAANRGLAGEYNFWSSWQLVLRGGRFWDFFFWFVCLFPGDWIHSLRPRVVPWNCLRAWRIHPKFCYEWDAFDQWSPEWMEGRSVDNAQLHDDKQPLNQPEYTGANPGNPNPKRTIYTYPWLAGTVALLISNRTLIKILSKKEEEPHSPLNSQWSLSSPLSSNLLSVGAEDQQNPSNNHQSIQTIIIKTNSKNSIVHPQFSTFAFPIPNCCHVWPSSKYPHSHFFFVGELRVRITRFARWGAL